MSSEMPKNGATTNDFPTSPEEMTEEELDEPIGGGSDSPDTPRVYDPKENKDLKTDGGVATNDNNDYSRGVPNHPVNLYHAICQEQVWENSQHNLQIEDTEFTLKDVAEDLDDPQSFLGYDWDSLEENMDQAVEEVENLYRDDKVVDIDKTTGDEQYLEVIVYGLEEQPDGPMGI